MFKHKDDKNHYYGLYHTLDPSISNYNMYLAKSKDGINDWQHITMLDQYASQARSWIAPNGKDIVVVYENSRKAGDSSNYISLKHFESLEDLK